MGGLIAFGSGQHSAAKNPLVGKRVFFVPRCAG
jgi:hypothetical protein